MIKKEEFLIIKSQLEELIEEDITFEGEEEMEINEEFSLSFNFTRPPMYASEIENFGSKNCSKC